VQSHRPASAAGIEPARSRPVGDRPACAAPRAPAGEIYELANEIRDGRVADYIPELARIGVEPTGEAFNAIVLDPASHRPFNPMVNAGAIATTDLILGKDYPERVARLMAALGRFAGRELDVDNGVLMSERMTGHRNRAVVHPMKAFGVVGDCFEESLELCSRRGAASPLPPERAEASSAPTMRRSLHNARP